MKTPLNQQVPAIAGLQSKAAKRLDPGAKKKTATTMRSLWWAAVVMFAALAASATTIDNSGDAQAPTTGWTAVAQTLKSPGEDLTSYSFWLGSSVPTITFQVYQGDVSQGFGTPLFTRTLSGLGPGEVTVSDINVATIAGMGYSIYMDLNGYSDDSVMWGLDAYDDGSGEWGYSDKGVSRIDRDDTGFIAVFGQPSTPEPGTLVLFGSGILGIAGMMRRKLMR